MNSISDKAILRGGLSRYLKANLDNYKGGLRFEYDKRSDSYYIVPAISISRKGSVCGNRYTLDDMCTNAIELMRSYKPLPSATQLKYKARNRKQNAI